MCWPARGGIRASWGSSPRGWSSATTARWWSSALDGDEGSGSARSIPGFDLLGALHATAEHLERYGGHRAAAGMTIRRDRVEAFREAFERHAEEALPDELLVAHERVDAIASGRELGLELAEELELLEPCGMGNPRPPTARPGSAIARSASDGGGPASAFRRLVRAGSVRGRWRSAATAGLGSSPRSRSTPRFAWSATSGEGAVEPRLILGHARSCAPEPIEVVGEAEDYLSAVLGELDRKASPPAGGAASQGAGSAGPVIPRTRTVLDRRGHSPLAVLADTLTAGGRVLAVCADTGRRLAGLQPRTGGFALTSYHATRTGAGRSARASCIWSRSILRPAPRPRRCSMRAAALPIWRGASLSYALHSRCTSWSTVSALRSWSSTGPSGCGRGWPARSSSTCFAETVRTVARLIWRLG